MRHKSTMGPEGRGEDPPALTGGLAFQGMAVRSWSAHIDYFTGTCEDHRGEARFPDESVLQSLIELYGTESMNRWQMRDYTGYSIGKVGWAERSTGSIRQITSKLAHTYVQSVARLPEKPNCTRLDITLDITLTKDIASCVQSIAMERSECIGVKRLGAPLLITSYGSGDTFYVGSPASAKRLRIYDKHRESGYDEQYENTIRYELQLRSPHSDTFFRQYGSYPNGQRAILSTIQNHCKRVRVYMPDIPCDTSPVPLRINEVEKTVDRQLEWLRSQVAPTVRRLCSAGYRERVLLALGLTEPE